MNNQIVYNPYNSKNRLFAKQDIQAILQKHRCKFTVRNVDLFQTAMVHSSYVKRVEYTTPTGYWHNDQIILWSYLISHTKHLNI